jgi:hypothetical protein
VQIFDYEAAAAPHSALLLLEHLAPRERLTKLSPKRDPALGAAWHARVQGRELCPAGPASGGSDGRPLPLIRWLHLGRVTAQLLSRLEAPRGPVGGRASSCDGLVWCLHSAEAASCRAAYVLGRLAAAISPGQLKILLFAKAWPVAEALQTAGRGAARGVAQRQFSASSEDKMVHCAEMAAAVAPGCAVEILLADAQTVEASGRMSALHLAPFAQLFLRLVGSLKTGAAARRRRCSLDPCASKELA